MQPYHRTYTLPPSYYEFSEKKFAKYLAHWEHDIFVTKRIRRCVLIQGYKLSENKQLKDRTFHFRCKNRKYNVTAIIGEKIDLIISQKNDHNHPATSENIINRQKIMSTLKRKAIDDVFTKPNKISRKYIKIKLPLI
ncbi:hypothetical protein QTP88_013118 [Uroleucon formosanum]